MSPAVAGPWAGGARGAERAVVAAILGAVLAYRLATLAPELAVREPHLNDLVLHDAAIRAASRAIGRFENPLDSWLPVVGCGYPFLRQYQPLPIAFAATIHRALAGAIDVPTVRSVLLVLALAAFPVAVYRGGRDLGLARLQAAFAAAVSPLLEAPLLMGLTDQSYMWRGYGLFTQAFGAVFLPLAIGAGVRAVETGRGHVRAGLLLGAALLCHMIYGWLAGLALGAVSLLTSRAPLGFRLARLALVAAVAASASLWFLVPALRDGAYANHSIVEPAEKWDSYGWKKVATLVCTGVLLDGVDRAMPAITLVAGAGLVIAIRRLTPARQRVLALAAFTLVLFAGRPALGPAIDFIPGARYLHLHRLICGPQLAAIYLAGIALGALARRIRALRSRLRLAVALALSAVALAPAIHERIRFAIGNAEMGRRAAQLVRADPEAGRLLAVLESAPPGRLYAGLPHRAHELGKVGEVPFHALAAARDIPNGAFLWHALALSGDFMFARFDPARAADSELFAVRYFVLPSTAAPPQHVRAVGEFGNFRLYEAVPAPHFALVSAPYRMEVAPREAFAAIERWYTSAERGRAIHPLVSLAGERWEAAGPRDRAPRGRVVREDLERVRDGRFGAAVEVEEPCYLMLRASYHPALEATVDGAPAPVACLAPGFAGVRLGPGRHEVRIFVARDPLRLPLAVAGAALLALVRWRLRARPLPVRGSR